MKKLTFSLTLVLATTAQAGWFTKETNPDHDPRIHAEERLTSTQSQLDATRVQLQQEHQSVNHLQYLSMTLGIICPILLIIGAILGASTRRKYAKE